MLLTNCVMSDALWQNVKEDWAKKFINIKKNNNNDLWMIIGYCWPCWWSAWRNAMGFFICWTERITLVHTTSSGSKFGFSFFSCFISPQSIDDAFFLVLRVRKATIDYFIISYAYIILCTWCILVYTQLLTQVVCVCLCLKATTSWETGKRGKPNCTIHYAHRIDWFSVFIVVVLSLASPRCLLFLSFLIENADDDDAGLMDEETGHYEDQLKYRHFTGLSHR